MLLARKLRSNFWARKRLDWPLKNFVARLAAINLQRTCGKAPSTSRTSHRLNKANGCRNNNITCLRQSRGHERQKNASHPYIHTHVWYACKHVGVRMCVYADIHTYIHTSVHSHIHEQVHAHINKQIYTYTHWAIIIDCVYTYMHNVFVYEYIYICDRSYMCVCTRVCCAYKGHHVLFMSVHTYCILTEPDTRTYACREYFFLVVKLSGWNSAVKLQSATSTPKIWKSAEHPPETLTPRPCLRRHRLKRSSSWIASAPPETMETGNRTV